MSTSFVFDIDKKIYVWNNIQITIAHLQRKLLQFFISSYLSLIKQIAISVYIITSLFRKSMYGTSQI